MGPSNVSHFVALKQGTRLIWQASSVLINFKGKKVLLAFLVGCLTK
jgi:hypothetical protein